MHGNILHAFLQTGWLVNYEYDKLKLNWFYNEIPKSLKTLFSLLILVMRYLMSYELYFHHNFRFGKVRKLSFCVNQNFKIVLSTTITQPTDS